MSDFLQFLGNFDVLCELGRGGFGKVVKIKDKTDDQTYALKVIESMDSNEETIKTILKEVKILAEISVKAYEYVIRYFHSWTKGNFVFIKMEFCSQNLFNLIEMKRQLFQRETSSQMDVVEYIISFELMKGLLTCVKGLHELSPPIIHRDLKPQNVLISDKPLNGNHLKICDFGLAVVHDMESMHTTNVGTTKYMAPEVSTGRYTIKADIYSVGRITEELFDININLSTPSTKHPVSRCFQKLQVLIKSMLDPIYGNRPACSDILDNIEGYGLTLSPQEIKEYQVHFTSFLAQNDHGCDIFKNYVEGYYEKLKELINNEKKPKPMSLLELRTQSLVEAMYDNDPYWPEYAKDYFGID